MSNETKKRPMLNTTINADVLEGFRNRCKENGFSMNMILETFMKQYADGEFYLKLGKNQVKSIEFSDDGE
jgi:hypothetical protein